MQVKVLKAFHYSFNGIDTVQLKPGETHDIAPQFAQGLRDLGVIAVEEAAVAEPNETATTKRTEDLPVTGTPPGAEKSASKERTETRSGEPSPPKEGASKAATAHAPKDPPKEGASSGSPKR